MKKNFTLKLHAKAFDDIQNAIDFYNERQKGLGKRFHFAVKQTFATIKKNPGLIIKN